MTPLLLVTGFLGAGKTTFLRALIPALRQQRLRPRIVLNDFEDARIDGATLADLAVDLVALSGSCVCCESLEELMDNLGALHGETGDVVVVEANGGTEASELLALVGGAPALDHLAPPLQITVVDAQRFAARGWQDEMEREQLLTATHVFVGRTDLVPPARTSEVRAAVARIAKGADFVTPVTMAEVLADTERQVRGLASRKSLQARWSPPSGCAPTPAGIHAHDHTGAGQHAHAPHFASHLIDLPHALDAEAFLNFLRDLPAEVLRAKGVVLLRAPAGEKRSFQKVDRDAEISPCELATPDAFAPRAVFIGPTLPVAALEAALNALAQPDNADNLAKPEPPAPVVPDETDAWPSAVPSKRP